MTFKRFGRAVLAYLFATLTVLACAAVAVSIVQVWIEVTFWQFSAGLWLLVVGVPSCGYSMQQVSKTLGIRPMPQLGVASWRSIPVFGGPGAVLADAVGAVLPGRQPAGEIEVPATWAFLSGSFVFPEEQVKELLQRGWSRQRRGKSAFARSAVLDAAPFYGDREAYERWCDICEAVGLLVNRKERHSGRLVLPPVLALSELAHKVRRVRFE